MTKRELLLIALASGGQAEYSPVQIQKLLFLIEKNIGDRIGGGQFDFIAYDYGPFDSAIYEELRGLATEGLAESMTTPRGWAKHKLTPEGVARGVRLGSALEASTFEYIRDVSNFVRSLSFSDLVSAVYKAYPEMKANSVFRG